MTPPGTSGGPSSGRAIAFRHALNDFQDVARQWQDAVGAHLDAAVATAEAARHEVQTDEEARAYCRRVRERWLRFQGGLPGDPMEPRSGHFETHGQLVHLGVRITKLTYESLPAVPVAGLLYQLDQSDAAGGSDTSGGKQPGIVFLCGHQGPAKRVEEVQRVCLDLALHGMVVLAIDPWGQGERHEYPAPTMGRPLVPPGTFEHSYGGLQCLLTGGGGVGRYFAWDAVRAVDVLAALPQVDASRIGATGNSGGGVQTTLLMLADERLAAAMPCTYITGMSEFFRTGQTLDAELSFPGTPAAGLDHADLLAAFAPRPLTVGGAAYDYFPIEGTEHAYEEARRLYALQGAGDRIKLAVTQVVHSYGDEMREAAVRFFSRELAGEERYQRRDLPTLPEDALLCSPTGQLYRDRPGQRGIYELNREFYAAHRRTPPTSGAEAAERLARALGPMPALGATPIRPRYYPPSAPPSDDSGALGYTVQHVFFWSEPRVAVAGTLLRPTRPPAAGVRPWLVLLPDGTASSDGALAEVVDLARSGALAFVFDPRGRGAVRSVPINDRNLYDQFMGEEDWLNYVEIMSGHTTLASRVYDVRRAVSFLEQFEGATGGVAMSASGTAALWGYLAAALDHRILAAHLTGMLPSWEAVVETRIFDSEKVTAALALPGVLQHLDLPDLRQCFGGRELVLDSPLRVEALPERLPLRDYRSRLPPQDSPARP